MMMMVIMMMIMMMIIIIAITIMTITISITFAIITTDYHKELKLLSGADSAEWGQGAKGQGSALTWFCCNRSVLSFPQCQCSCLHVLSLVPIYRGQCAWYLATKLGANLPRTVRLVSGHLVCANLPTTVRLVSGHVLAQIPDLIPRLNPARGKGLGEGWGSKMGSIFE